MDVRPTFSNRMNLSYEQQQQQRLSGYSSSWQQPSPPASPSTNHKTLAAHSVIPLSAERPRRREIKDFKPFAHRTLPLLALFLIVLGLIGALEYGMRVLPQATSGTLSQTIAQHLPDFDKRSGEPLNRRELQKRQTALFSTNGPRTTPAAGRPGTFTFDDFTPPAENSQTSRSTISYGVVPDSYLNPSAETILSVVDPGPTQIDAVDAPPDPTPVPAAAEQSADAASPADGAVASSRAVPMTTVAMITNAATPAATGAVSVASSSGRTGTGTGSSRARPTITASANPSLYVSPTSGINYVVTTTLGFGTRTTSGGRPLITLPAGMLDSDVPLTLIREKQNYFFSQYLPAVVAVLIRLIFSYLHRSTKLLDPFFMLNDAGGAAAFDFYKSDHLGTELLFAPFHALRARRWLMLWTAVLYACAQIIIPFAAELTSIHNSNYTFLVKNGYGMARGHAVWVNPVIGRLIQGLLSFMAIMLIVIWAMLRRHRSGISGNPASIATIASLLSHPTTTADFACLYQGSSKMAIQRSFGDRRYKLGYYQSIDGSERYGILPVDVSFDDGRETAYGGGGGTGMGPGSEPAMLRSSAYSHVRQTSELVRNGPPKARLLKGIIPLSLITCTSIALFGVILAYYLNRDPNNEFELFMDSQSFGPRFMLSTLALLVKAPLVSLCAKAAASVPFSRLHRRGRPAEPDVVSSVPLTPLGAVPFALKRREWYAAALAISAGIIIEVMLILIPGVPFHNQQIWLAAAAGWYGCMACLAAFVLVAIAGWVRLFRQQGEFRWPQNPGRIGAVAMYVAGTRMADDMATSLAAREERVASEGKSAGRARAKDVARAWRQDVNGWGARYDFDVRDGRWVVEYEEHGKGERMEDVAQMLVGGQAASMQSGSNYGQRTHIYHQAGEVSAGEVPTSPQMQRFANMRYDVPHIQRRGPTHSEDVGADFEGHGAWSPTEAGARHHDRTGVAGASESTSLMYGNRR